ncbi:MAG: hypothetical protein WBW31_14840 [Candidatus Sulfotelmatobacter sp.]
MNGLVDWIGAEADDSAPEDELTSGSPLAPEDERALEEPSHGGAPCEELPAHHFPAGLNVGDDPQLEEARPGDARLEDDPLDRNPDLWLYRKRTVGLLRRYMRFSLETGRLPSFVGREFFRAKVTYYTATTFEDRVIFVRDVEKCMNRLEYSDQQLIARIILQEHGQEQTARILQCSRSSVARRLPEVLDLLSEDFLRVGLLAGLPSRREFSR